VCAVDLPGHGARFDESLQTSDRILEVVLQMAHEIESVLSGLSNFEGFDMNAAALGGMSAGGLVAILHMLREHPFRAAVLEATGGSWEPLRNLPMCKTLSDEEFDTLNPINRLDGWRDIPVVAFHSRQDAWMPFRAESDFIDAIKKRSSFPEDIELVAFDHTGAPEEHMGFGRETAFVKEVQVDFLAKHILKKVMP